MVLVLFLSASACGSGSSADGAGGATATTAGQTSVAGASSLAGSASTGGSSGASPSGGASSAGSTTTAGVGPSGGAGTTGGVSATGGASTGGATGGASTGGASTGGQTGSAGASGAGGAGATAHFSFFVTSLEAIRRESKSENGFGGDLGGLAGADAICTRIAEAAVPGSGAKGWRAFLSTTTVNAIDRIGAGPWYDRNEGIIANNTAGLLMERPAGTTTINDLPNELGLPNRAGTGTGMDDNHDTITASNAMGKYDGGSTCNDWTSASGSGGPRVGHSWPAQSGRSWLQAHNAPGCAPSVSLVQTGAGSGDGIGNGGGYGGFYCFALKP
ncbi:MAG TPA: hypothetical protein VEQ59_18590 [Polyangiaceae bacterium]|nr:hypothetical protein [Polyangiaceae bacterium]